MTTTQTKTVLTYHSDPALKKRIVADARGHLEADRYIQGVYLSVDDADTWRGCAVGCTTAPLVAEARGVPVSSLTLDEPEDWHAEQERHAGIPVWLGAVLDTIHEALPPGQAREWPLRLLDATPVGADLTRAREAWLRDLVLDPEHGAMAHAARALDAAGLSRQAETLRALPRDAAWDIAEAAARGAWGAAARGARYVARDAAWDAAWAAARAAEAATRAAMRAADAGVVVQWMADRLIHHIEAAS